MSLNQKNSHIKIKNKLNSFVSQYLVKKYTHHNKKIIKKYFKKNKIIETSRGVWVFISITTVDRYVDIIREVIRKILRFEKYQFTDSSHPFCSTRSATNLYPFSL